MRIANAKKSFRENKLLAEFEIAADAMECSVNIQIRLKKKYVRFVEDKRLKFVGGSKRIDLGDVKC